MPDINTEQSALVLAARFMGGVGRVPGGTGIEFFCNESASLGGGKYSLWIMGPILCSEGPLVRRSFVPHF